VDIRHEIGSAYHLSSTRMGDNEAFTDLLHENLAIPSFRTS
jgi:hypothetical protein